MPQSVERDLYIKCMRKRDQPAPPAMGAAAAAEQAEERRRRRRVRGA
jgi:hypothetical protein